MNAGNARIATENARVDLVARRVYFSPLAACAAHAFAAADDEPFEDKMKRHTGTLLNLTRRRSVLAGSACASIFSL